MSKLDTPSSNKSLRPFLIPLALLGAGVSLGRWSIVTDSSVLMLAAFGVGAVGMIWLLGQTLGDFFED